MSLMIETNLQPTHGNQPYFPGIQDLRGWAALCVVFYHAHVLFHKEKYFGVDVLWGFFEFGHRGVDLFFVISGFLMAMLTQDFSKNKRPLQFLTSRAKRIYIPYFPILIMLSTACLFSKNTCPSAYVFDFQSILMNAVILPRENLNTFIPVVAWTLSHELFFYFMTFIILLFGANGNAVFLIWLALSAVLNVAGIDLVFPFSFIFSPYNLAFGLGFLAFNINQKYFHRISHRFCLYVGVVVFLTLGFIESFWGSPSARGADLNFMLMYFFAAFMLVIGFVGRPTSWMRNLGNASYAIYLVHYPLLVVLSILASRLLGGVVPVHLTFAVEMLLVLGCGWLYHIWVEKPCLQRFGRRLSS